jgi:Holliday junction DNA helicase RuvA
MIGRLRGRLVEEHLDGSCVIDVGGVGYEVFTPLGSLGRLSGQGASPGGVAPEADGPPVELHIHTHVREEALVLYGFASRDDRAAFRAVLGISGVGPKLALAILSVLDAPGLAEAVATGDRARFRGIPGVGKKTIERLVLELPDKLPRSVAAAGRPRAVPVRSASGGSGDAPTSALDQVQSALVRLGYKPAEAERAIAPLRGREDEPLESLIREALASFV